MSPRALFDAAPPSGHAVEVADGVLWMRIALPMALDHVNVYALADPDGWTVVDTGFDKPRTREEWQALLSGPLSGKPVARVLATHYHPDHIGLAGWFQAQGAELLTTRTSWLYARMLVLDRHETHAPQTLAHWRMAGMDAEIYADRLAERPYNFADGVHPLPLGYSRLFEGQTLRLGGRDWLVRMGDGHAPEHATLWSLSDDLVIGGDQFLPKISPVIGVYATEPAADPLGEWLESCARFLNHAEDRHRVLPGHKVPFAGLPSRLQQMIDHHEGALDKLLAHLDRPRVACDCFAALFTRRIGPEMYGFAMSEALAHLNHLLTRGLVRKIPGPEGAVLWQAI